VEGPFPTPVPPWSDDRVWDAVIGHRWYPPSSLKVRTDHYELAVTPGSYTLTWIYGFDPVDAPHAEVLLDEIRKRVESLGGTGARIQVTPRSRPADLPHRLREHGFTSGDAAEVLVWDLRDDRGEPRLPSVRAAPEVSVREITTVEEYDLCRELSVEIFADPVHSPRVRDEFLAALRRRLRETGHSGQFLAVEGTRAVGSGGLEVDGPVGLLWGAGVRAHDRGRGTYGALLRVRCAAAAERGAEIALVYARVGTSGPMLKHYGFRTVGPIETFEARWSG
jgi:hypothetical protein